MIPVRYIPDPEWIICTRCDGVGTIESKKPFAEPETCPECKGEGLINPEDDFT
jgi:DnaJ-class molecular chaperone